MTPAEFVTATLQTIRLQFYAKATERQYFQEVPWLQRAITYPASWLKERGGQWVTIGLMRKIIGTVVAAIKKHGDRANIGRFSIYFLKCVQEHMKHHGDEYLEEAKRMPSIGRALPGVLRGIKEKIGTVDPGEVLAETHRVLSTTKRGKKKPNSGDSAADLFGSCKPSAKAMQNGKKFLKPLQNIAGSSISPQTSIFHLGDS